MDSLEMLANNLANASTSGYKTDREFYSLYVAPDAMTADAAEPPSVLPVIERCWTDFAQGTLTPTGNPLDLALSGRGFFVVQGPSGPLYTRSGNFVASASGELTSADGYPLRAQGGGRVRLLSAAPVEAAPDGTISQGGQVLGRLELVNFPNPGGLAKVGKSYFRAADPQLKPSPAAVRVHQGQLESSNVGAAEAAVRLVAILRQFEMLQKAVALGTEMNRHAIEEVARVGS